MKNKLLMFFIIISSLILCSCEKKIRIVYRHQIIVFMGINTIVVHYVVIIIQVLSESGNYENSKQVHIIRYDTFLFYKCLCCSIG